MNTLNFSKALPVMILLVAIVDSSLPSYRLALNTQRDIDTYYANISMKKKFTAAVIKAALCFIPKKIFTLIE
ncbi:MAG: hypothetical protein LBR90_00545 [Elusimicrobiota bacterium]|jgi:hypothetical protein|nr:hypothetical protein [Elusimicrobiota bacterium]